MAAGVDTITFSLHPNYCLTLKLFKDVKNASDVRRKITEENMPAALLRPCLVTSSFTVMVAANKAVHNATVGKMKTKSVHTELIYSLSPTHNISESLKKFGVHDKDCELLMACVHNKEDSSKLESHFNQVDGIPCEIENIKDYSNTEQIKKLYKITDEELKIGTLADAVVCRIAVKDCG